MSYLDELFSLQGKTAVVIGGTGELCGAMAAALAKAGAEVVLVGRSQEKATARLEQIRAAGGRGYFLAADILTREGLQKLLADVVAKSGQCDVLINGAGINAPTPFLEISEEEYDRIFAVNAKAVFVACQVFGQYFLDNAIQASI
ncbi:SDR family NAD(P)-dependent oxidoreductase, partial [Pseudomonadota bacterium]